MKDNTKALISNIIARIATEYELNDIKRAATKSFKEYKQVDESFIILRVRIVNENISSRIINMINKIMFR